MLKTSTLSSILLLFLISPFVSQAQDITKEKMIAYFDIDYICSTYSPLDVPKMAPNFTKSDSLTQLMNNMQEQAQSVSEDELSMLETKYTETLSEWENLQTKLHTAHMEHCEKLLSQSELDLTWTTLLKIKNGLQYDDDGISSLYIDVLTEKFDARMNDPKTIIEGMDDDTFITHLSYYVEYILRQQKAQEATSEREAFRKETELEDYYQSLISEGKITNEQMDKLDHKINNDYMLTVLVQGLLSGRISLR